MSTAADLVDIDRFMPDLETELPTCPIPVIERRLRDALIEACERANLWRWDHPELYVTADNTDYEFFAPTDDSRVHSILELTYRGRDLLAYPKEFEVLDRSMIRLHNIPKVDSSPAADADRPIKGILAVLSIKPTRDAATVTRVLYDDFYDLVIIGTLARAWGMVGREWSNPNMSVVYDRHFETEIGKARQAVDRNFVTTSQRFYARRFAASARRGY